MHLFYWSVNLILDWIDQFDLINREGKIVSLTRSLSHNIIMDIERFPERDFLPMTIVWCPIPLLTYEREIDR